MALIFIHLQMLKEPLSANVLLARGKLFQILFDIQFSYANSQYVIGKKRYVSNSTLPRSFGQSTDYLNKQESNFPQTHQKVLEDKRRETWDFDKSLSSRTY